MNAVKPSDPRLEAILDFISNLASGRLPPRLPAARREQGDAPDQIIAQLNTLAERLGGHEGELRTEAEHRLNELVEVMMAVASLDFSRRATIGETRDVVDALATGLNMLTEELQAAIVRREQTEAALLKQTVELEEAYRLQQEHQTQLLASEKMATLGWLTAGIAHEMNTPLAAVRTALVELDKLTQEYENSLGDPSVTPEDYRAITQEMRQSIQLAQKAAERSAGFVRGIKSQTRDLAPQEHLRFDVAPVIQDTLQILGHALRYKKCTANLEAEAGPIYLHGSPGRLAQVVTNLVTNAIDAMAEQGGGLLTLRLASQADGVELQVSDVGSGIPPEIVSKIFEPMFTTKPFGQGTGLGLTVVRDIVTGDFGGSIAVTSSPGHGTTFTLRFPAAGGSSGVGVTHDS